MPKEEFSEIKGFNALFACRVWKHKFRLPAKPKRPANIPKSYRWEAWASIRTDTGAMGLWMDPAADAAEAVTLGYGKTAVQGDIACASAKTGLTCWDIKTKHGFWVSSEGYATW